MQNKKIVLTKVLEGSSEPGDFRVVEESVPEPAAGEVLVRHHCLSLDPYQRPAMAGRHGGSSGPLGEGDMPPGETVGRVIKSRHSKFAEGDFVRHFGGWQEYSAGDGNEMVLVDESRAPLSAFLGVLGMPGLTAYASMVKLAEVGAGQTVLVSAAAGPVGSTVGQIAMQRGARAVGIAGSDEKCAFVTEELGFDACVNYKKERLPEALHTVLPDGADIYHDNVGGQMLIDAMSALKLYGTVILCGLMSSYNDPDQARSLPLVLPMMKRAVIKSVIVYDFEEQRDEFVDLMAPWVKEGKVKFKEDRVTGIEHAGEHFCRLMRGENFGKALVVMDSTG